MPLDWSPLVELLRRHDRPLLMTHIRPDADGLGAQLALAEGLRQLGKSPRVAIAASYQRARVAKKRLMQSISSCLSTSTHTR